MDSSLVRRGEGARPWPTRATTTWVVGATCIVAAYYPAARLGLLFQLGHSNVTPIWPPAGIALAALLRMGFRYWPAVTVGAFLVNVTTGLSPLVAGGLAIGNTLEAVIAAQLLVRVDFHHELDRTRDILAIVVCSAVMGCVVAAGIGTGTLLLGGVVERSSALLTWGVYWLGDAAGVLVVAPPLLLHWKGGLRFRARPPAMVEPALVLIALLGVSAWIFLGGEQPYLVLLLFGWAAARGRQTAATAITVIISVIAVTSTTHGHGPFAPGDTTSQLVQLELFLSSVAVMGMTLAAAVTESATAQARERVQAAELKGHRDRVHLMNLAAHELRSPLGVLRGYLHMLSDGDFGRVPDSCEPPLRVAREKADDLNRLVDDVLTAARAANGRITVSLRSVDLGVLARDAAERARARAELLGGRVEQPGNGACEAHADGDLVTRILDNLINNAMTYSDDAPHVRIESGTREGMPGLIVRDNGRGIPTELHTRVFEEFFRIGDDVHRPTTGTGLGLYIARHLATAMGGSLILERSSPGEGSTFALWLRPPGG